MDGPLENLYFKWLCAKVIKVVHHPTPSLTYRKLLTILHTTEFVWLVSRDDNRADDGIELRDEFLYETDVPEDYDWRILGCSILEMLIALSRRAEFQNGEPARDWFWKFLRNLRLDECTDADIEPTEVEDILDEFVWRTYAYNGEGGLFPLRHPMKDQRTVEIWYQFHAYLEENDPVT